MKVNWSLCLSLSLLLTSMPLGAQRTERKRVLGALNTGRVAASLDLQTGVLVRGPRIRKKALVPFSSTVSLENTDFSGFLGIDSGPNGLFGPARWVSNADKGAAPVFDGSGPGSGSRSVGGQSTFIESFVFAYCSAVQDVLSGGTGAALTVEFFEGYSPGTVNAGGATGTSVAALSLTGLPAATGFTGFLGTGFQNCRVVLMQINLGSVPICLADGNFGYGFQFDYLDSGGILGGTALFLGCVQSCSGPGPDSIGQVDNIDRYVSGTYESSFAFSTAGSFPANRSGVALRLVEQEPISSAATISNGSGINTQTLGTVSPPILGGLYSESPDCTGFPPGKFASWRIAFLAAPPILLGGNLGELLVSIIPGTGLDLLVVDHLGGVVSFPLTPVPKDLTFYGFDIFVQGFCGGVALDDAGRTNLSNLVKRAVGSF